MPITACKGTVDILPTETYRWRYVEEVAHRVAQLFGFKEIRTPAFEVTELFNEATGDDSDVIERELYTFRDKSGRSLTLRPEMTVPTVRAYLEHNLGNQQQLKAYYLSEIWRYERPVPGRTREAHQFGVEAIGSASPALDAELIDVALHFFAQLGLKDLRLEVNSIGCKRCRPAYQQSLRDFFMGKDDVLCQDCERLKDRNPLRVLDCKKEGCLQVTNTVPTIFQTLCAECKTHFFAFKEHLTQMGHAVFGNPRVIHGFGYYTRTVFQIHSPHLGPHNPLCSGGRFDDLISQLGSNATPAIGFAIGLERTLLALEKATVQLPAEPALDVFLVGTGEEAERIMTRTLHQLRTRGFRAERDFMGRGVKNQMKFAEKLTPTYIVAVGEEETRVSQVSINDVARGTSENISVNRLLESLEYRLRRDQREKSRSKEQDDRRPERGSDDRDRDRGRGRGRDRYRGRDDHQREEREVRPRGDERAERERDEDGARFSEWAAVYSEAARASVPRSQRRVPLSESAFDTAEEVAMPPAEVWALTQIGLQAPANSDAEAPWPPAPMELLSGVPPRRANHTPPLSAAGLDDPFRLSAAADENDDENDDDDDDDDEGDEGNGDSDGLAAAGATRQGSDADKRRRGGRRGGRRHGRRKPKGKG